MISHLILHPVLRQLSDLGSDQQAHRWIAPAGPSLPGVRDPSSSSGMARRFLQFQTFLIPSAAGAFVAHALQLQLVMVRGIGHEIYLPDHLKNSIPTTHQASHHPYGRELQKWVMFTSRMHRCPMIRGCVRHMPIVTARIGSVSKQVARVTARVAAIWAVKLEGKRNHQPEGVTAAVPNLHSQPEEMQAWILLAEKDGVKAMSVVQIAGQHPQKKCRPARPPSISDRGGQMAKLEARDARLDVLTVSGKALVSWPLH